MAELKRCESFKGAVMEYMPSLKISDKDHVITCCVSGIWGFFLPIELPNPLIAFSKVGVSKALVCHPSSAQS